jgi:hypothetical protein
VLTSEHQVVSVDNSIKSFREKIKKSYVMGLKALDDLLYAFMNLNNTEIMSGIIYP